MANVGVVFGGRSVEHDVSIVTAHQAMAVLARRHTVVPIYVTRDGRWLTSERLNDLEVYRSKRFDAVGEPAILPAGAGHGGLLVPGGRLKGTRTIPLDVVVCAIHGTNGEDGTLQGALELAGLPYTGSGVAASAIGLDKVAMKAALRAAGLPVVDDLLVEAERLDGDMDGVTNEVATTLGFPVFTKPARAGSSVGIARATDAASLREALDVARRYDRRILIERAMEGCIEVNCSVLGGIGHEPVASVCEQPVAWEEFLTFQDKYMRAGKGSKTAGMAAQERRIPAPISDALTKQVQENALRAFRAIDASGVARVDSFVDESTGQAWVMEINTMPGSFAFYLWEASGKSFDDLLEALLEIAHATHRARSELMFTFESGMLDGLRGQKSADGKDRE